MLDVDKLAQMEQGTIEKVDVTPYKTNVRAALIVGDTGGMYDVSGRNVRCDMLEVIFDHWKCTLCRARCCVWRR